jgi:hypothetical protein
MGGVCSTHARKGKPYKGLVENRERKDSSEDIR